jgi:hypothetical protein
MESFKTSARVLFPDRAEEHLIDTVFYEGRWWLVGEWSVCRATQERVPLILVRPLDMEFEEVRAAEYRFELSNLVPKCALDGEKSTGFEVADFRGLVHTPGPGSIH